MGKIEKGSLNRLTEAQIKKDLKASGYTDREIAVKILTDRVLELTFKKITAIRKKFPEVDCGFTILGGVEGGKATTTLQAISGQGGIVARSAAKAIEHVLGDDMPSELRKMIIMSFFETKEDMKKKASELSKLLEGLQGVLKKAVKK